SRNTVSCPTAVWKFAIEATYQRKTSVVTIHVETTSTPPTLAQRFGRCSAGAKRTSSPATATSAAIAPSQQAASATYAQPPFGVGTASTRSMAPTTPDTTETASPSERGQRINNGRRSSTS